MHVSKEDSPLLPVCLEPLMHGQSTTTFFDHLETYVGEDTKVTICPSCPSNQRNQVCICDTNCCHEVMTNCFALSLSHNLELQILEYRILMSLTLSLHNNYDILYTLFVHDF